MKNLVIAYPKNVPYRSTVELLEFYNSFIELLLETSCVENLHILVRPQAEAYLKSYISVLNQNNRTNVILHPCNVQDIWVRDYFPVKYTDGVETEYKLYRYKPSYYKDNEHKYAEMDQTCAQLLLDEVGIKYSEAIVAGRHLILDGGNTSLSETGTLLVTNQVVKDNIELSISQITNHFQSMLGVHKVNIIPVEPGDLTGHTDGTFRFLGDSLLVSRCDGNKAYIEEVLKTSISDEYRIENIPVEYYDTTIYDRVPNVLGNSLNFILINGVLFLPTFKNNPIELDEGIFYSKGVKKVVHVPSDALAMLGGVLHCTTWEF